MQRISASQLSLPWKYALQVFDKRAKTYLVSSGSPDETENTAEEEKKQHW